MRIESSSLSLKYRLDVHVIMAAITISCPVNPSEDPDKVRSAILSIFPDAELEQDDHGFRGTAPGLDRFAQLIRRQKILDATRAVMMTGIRGTRTRMLLNKQVATVGKVSFADRNPVLGAIEVFVEDEFIEDYVDRIAPVTVDGEEVRV